MLLFLDTSALAKRYLAETGSGWVRAVIDPASGNTIAVANITRVEIGAAIARRQRDPRSQMSLADRDALIHFFDHHVAHEYLLVATTAHIIDTAYHLTQQYQLRGYDALQLGSALILNEVLVATGVPALTVVASDRELQFAAHAEGLLTDDPVLHP